MPYASLSIEDTINQMHHTSAQRRLVAVILLLWVICPLVVMADFDSWNRKTREFSWMRV